MAKKLDKKLLISLVLVIVLIVCAFSMIACNKKKGNETNDGTSVSPVVGTTTMTIDNVDVKSSGSIPTDYTKVALDTTKYEYIAQQKIGSGATYWIIKDLTPVTINATDVYTYYLYDAINGSTIKSFNIYYTAPWSLHGNGGGYYYYLTLASIVYNTTTSKYEYTGASYDWTGNQLFKERTDTYDTLQQGPNSLLLYTFDYNDYRDLDDELNLATDGTKYFTGKYYDADSDTLSTYKVNLSTYELTPYADTTSTPSYAVGNKYIEKTEVPGLSGYYYYESKSTNSILFYNSFTASAPTSTLSLDFGTLEVKFDTSYIVGGKVFIYGSAVLPEAATDYDFCSPSIVGTLKGKTALYVYDIASGSLNQILKGYQIDDKFNVFSANNKKAYIAVEVCGISAEKIVNPTSMYYIVDADGNFVVSTPELFDTTKITSKLENGYYIYDGTTDYLLDNCLNTVCYLNNLAYKSEKALVTTNADGSKAYFMDGTGTISFIATTADYSYEELFGQYILATELSGNYVSVKLGESQPKTIYNPVTESGVSCYYLANGVFMKVTTATNTVMFMTCDNNQIGQSFTLAETPNVGYNCNAYIVDGKLAVEFQLTTGTIFYVLQ